MSYQHMLGQAQTYLIPGQPSYGGQPSHGGQRVLVQQPAYGYTMQPQPMQSYGPPKPKHCIGASRKCCSGQRETFRLKEHIFRGDRFSIENATTRQPFMEVKSAHLTMHERKTFCLASGQELFSVVKKHFHWHLTYEAVDPKDNDRVFFTVKKKFHIGGDKLSITFENRADDKRDMELILKGSWFNHSATVKTNDDRVVAKVSKDSLNIKELLTDKDTYYLTVEPGIDQAMMVACAELLLSASELIFRSACVLFDEIAHDKKDDGGILNL